MPQAAPQYSAAAKTIHWAMAALILVSAGIGLTLEGIPRGPGRTWWTAQHEITGFLVIVALLIRVSWRVSAGAPPLPGSMPRWQIQAAHAAHYGLYVLMLASPLVGMMLSSARGRTVSVWGLFNVPPLWSGPDRLWGGRLEALHSVLSYALLAVVVIHFLSALYHHFIVHDDILRRMLPGYRAAKQS
jgi:cytochrome b561